MTYYDWIGYTDEAHTPGHGAPEIADPEGVCLFIDFDGTLVDIAETPDAVRVADGTLDVLAGVLAATGRKAAIVSGRPLSALERFLPGFEGPMIGSHGAEWWADGERHTHPAAGSDDLNSIRTVVAGFLEQEPGIRLEEKPASIVLHFRQAPDRAADAEAFLAALVRQREGWKLHHAKMALEVMPSDVSKGRAIRPFVDRWRPAKPLAIGDDRTDEGMFSFVQEQGGHGIKVGSDGSCASHCLLTVGDVHAFLRGIAARGSRPE